ncbi:hypothetical protein JWF83_11935 [Pantoea sp. B65]
MKKMDRTVFFDNLTSRSMEMVNKMPLSIFMTFWAVSALFVITPGADRDYAISAGIRGSTVVPAVGGLPFGHLIATIIVAAGVGTFVAGYPAALTFLTVTGAAMAIIAVLLLAEQFFREYTQ